MRSMVSGDLLVRVKKPLHTSLQNLMNDMRSWLDHRGIEPVNFKPITLDSGLAFDVSFCYLQQADVFRGKFERRLLR